MDDEEELVLRVVMVPDELALQLDELDLHVVDVADHARMPVVADPGELLGQVHGIHVRAPASQQRVSSLIARLSVPEAGSYSKSLPEHWNLGGAMSSPTTAALSGGHWPFSA